MAIAAAQLIANVAVTGVDTAETQILSMGAAANAGGGYLASLGASAFSTGVGFNGMADASMQATVSLADISAIADADTISLSGLAAAADADATAYWDAIAAYDAATAALDANAAAADAAAASNVLASKGATSSAAGFDAMAVATDGASAAADAAGHVFSFIGDMFKYAALAAGIVTVASVFLAGKFQQSMTLLVTSAGESRNAIKMVADGILQMSVDTATSTTKLAAAMFTVESASYHGAAGLQVLKAAAQGAKIENADLVGVVEALTTTLHDFHEPASQAIDVMNSFREAASIGKMRMDDFTGAMKNVGPVASLAKVQLTDVEGALSAMSLEGDKGAAAGTHLAQSLLNMINPTAKAKAILAEIGMTSQQVSDEMQKSLPGVLAEITDALGRKFPAGSQAYNAALATMFGGTRGLKAILELTGANMKDFAHDAALLAPIMRENASAVGGWADVQGNFNFQVEAAVMSVNTLLIKIGTALLPTLSQLFGIVTNVISIFTAWVDKSNILSNVAQTLGGWIGYIGDAFHQVFDAVAPVSDAFNRTTTALMAMAPVVSPFTDAIDRMHGSLAAVTDGFDRSKTSLMGMNPVVKNSANAWIPFWQEVQHVRYLLSQIDWGSVTGAFEKIRVAISKMDWGKVGQFFSDIVTAISKVDWTMVGTALEKLVIALTKVDWGKVGAAIAGIINSLLQVDWKKFGDDATRAFEALSKVDWVGVAKSIKSVTDGIQAMQDMFSFFGTWIEGGWLANLITFIVGWFVSLYHQLVGGSIIPDLINGIVRWFASLPGRLSGVILGTIASIVGWWNTLPGKLSTIINGLVGNIGQWWGRLPGIIGGIAGSIISALVSPFQSASGTISGIIGTIGGWINNLLGQIGSAQGAAAAIPNRPGFASGTDSAPGGLSWVGEQGPELMYIPRGAQIIPNNKIGGVAGAGGAPQTIVVNPPPIYLDGRLLTNGMMPYIANAIRANTGARF